MGKKLFFEDTGFISYFVNAGNVDVYIMNYAGTNNPDRAKLSRTFHTHAFAEIFYCPKESYSVYVDNYKVTLGAGEFLIVPSGCSHIKDPDTDAKWCSSLILTSKRQEPDGADFYSEMKELFSSGKLWLVKGNRELCERFDRIGNLREPELLPKDFAEIISVLAGLFSAERELKGSFNIPKALSIKEAYDFERLFAIVSQNNLNRLAMSDAAKAMCVSERQLARYCGKFFGKNYREITFDIQLKTAAYYLVHTDKSIEEIAELINMNTTFTRNFTRAYEMTPLRYRKLNRG